MLDYLTNMGGYTGFTEGQLKGDGASDELERQDISDFGQPTELGEGGEATTTIFVLLLILFPSTLGIIGIKIFGPPAIFTFAAPPST